MITDDFKNTMQLWDALKANRERYKPVWDAISKYVGITVAPDYLWSSQQSNAASMLDTMVDDPTASTAVNQAGDYLVGILWGTGDQAFDIIPSRYVLELADAAVVSDWFNFATEQVLYHINHPDAGFHTALQPYSYDQFAFGTSGIGAFENKDYKAGIADNCIMFRNYGIDNTCIDEGKNGQIDYVFPVHKWRVSRIVGEFCMKNGIIDTHEIDEMPKVIKDAWYKQDLNQEFSIVFGVMPRSDYDPKLLGKRGTKYKGVWFMDGQNPDKFFHEEDFAERPINMCRQIKVRGQVYGRSSGTLLMSTIRSVNFMVGTVIEIIEKMSNPSLGMFSNAIFGDTVLDTSPNGLTIFNQNANANGTPMFPIHDVGDPSGIAEFLIPYLNDKVTTAFKIDALLDFNSNNKMTATESLQRYNIRGKSLAGMMQQQKTEMLEPTVRRSISIVHNCGELGINPRTDQARARAVNERGKPERVIPDEVLDVMAAGKPWYQIKFNNEMEKLTRTEAVQNLLQVLNGIAAIAGMYPEIIEAVDWYQLLKDINDNLDYNNKILYSADEFKAKIAAIAKQKQVAMMAEAGMASGQIQKDQSIANKNNKEAQNAGAAAA